MTRTLLAQRTDNRHARKRLVATAALLLSLCTPQSKAQSAINTGGSCGSLHNGFGPYDYRKDRGEPLQLVESAHFRPEMESLIRGGQGPRSLVGPEFDYTLRAFPNHHRALLALIRLGERDKSPQPQEMRYTIDCWFERALRFAPDDTIARMIYVSYLIKQKRTDEARSELARATAAAGDNPFSLYNAGMLYLELKDYDLALRQAHRAYGMGMQQPALRDQLRQAGRWIDPPDAPASAASSPNADGK